ncbi:MAG: hypothetical protein AB8B56_21770 [Crocinitomicaceae bacterium]
MKNVIFLFFITCTFFSYSQDKDSYLKGIFKNYKALTACKQVSRKKAKEFLEQKQWSTNYQLPKNASYKIASVKMNEEKEALFVLLGNRLFVIADSDILVSADAPPVDQPEPTPDPIPRDPKPEPTPTPDPKDPKDPEDEDDGRHAEEEFITCCGKSYPCVRDQCDCDIQAPNCSDGKGENELFFEMLIVQQF